MCKREDKYEEKRQLLYFLSSIQNGKLFFEITVNIVECFSVTKNRRNGKKRIKTRW